MANFIVAGWIM